MKLALQRLADRYTLHRLSSGSPLPAGLTEEPFYAVLRSEDELSVCCRERLPVASDRREDGWAALRVAGPLDFALTGIVAGLTAPLAEAGIPVSVSIAPVIPFVTEPDLERVMEALEEALQP